MGFKKQVGKLFTRLDIFGETVSVYYRGSNKYQTKVGAFFTIFIVILLSYVGYYKFEQLINKKDPSIQQYYKKMNMTENQNVEQQNFGIRVGLRLCDSNFVCNYEQFPTDLFEIMTYQLDSIMGQSPAKSQTHCQIPSQVILTNSQKSALNSSICANLTGMVLAGNPNAGDQGRSIQIMLNLRCRQEGNCDSHPIVQKMQKKDQSGIVVLTTQEYIIDFDDQTQPFKYNEAIIASFGFHELMIQTETTYSIQTLVSNEARINDNIWQTPFLAESQVITKFLTSESVPIQQSIAGNNRTLIWLSLTLKDKQLVSTRTVYNILGFFSDMGGITGLLIPFTAFLLKLLQTPQFYLVSLLKHMRPVLKQKFKKSKRSIKDKYSGSSQFKLEKDDMIEIIQWLRNYTKFQASVLVRLFACYLPTCWQSVKTKRTIKLIQKFKKRLEKSLDVRRIMERDVDLQLLLKYLMNDKRYFLFKHQRIRYLTTLDEEEDRDCNTQRIVQLKQLKDWTITDDLDRKLLKGFFQT